MPRISAEALAAELIQSRPSVVAVDGSLGAGKSTLAVKLAAALDRECVRLDDFLTPHRGTFLAHLDYARLHSQLDGQPVVVEGVCILAALERVQIEPDLLVFVAERPIKGAVAASELAQEVIDYQSTYQPKDNADYVVDMAAESENLRLQVDIAYINAKTKLALALAIGGILAILAGALVFVLGASGSDTAHIKVAGMEISASGIGAVILATSSVWGYLAYLARPKYARSRETSRTEQADGSTAVREMESSTMAIAARLPDDKH